MRKDRIPTINGDEQDWTTRWRKFLCVFNNHTGLGKKVKRAINKRARKLAKKDIENRNSDNDNSNSTF